MVCPMRVLLVVASTGIAGYFAWRAWNQPEEVYLVHGDDVKTQDSSVKAVQTKSQQIYEKLAAFLMLLFDMASGRYLYRVMRDGNSGHGNSVFADSTNSSVPANCIFAQPPALSPAVSLDGKVD